MDTTIQIGPCQELLPHIPNGSVHLTVTSPPYDNLRSYEGFGNPGFPEFYEVAKELYRVTCDGGIVVWNVQDATINGGESLTSFKQAIYFVENCGFSLHDTMIWQKSNFSNPAKGRYHQTFEYVFIFVKGKPRVFNPICDRPNIFAGKLGSFGNNTVTQVDGSKKTRPQKVNKEFGMRHNVWLTQTAGQDQSSKKWGHPAMFPVAFAADHIKSWSNEGDLVLDPFCGSGTTLVAARRLNRSSLGMEVNAAYAHIALERLSNEA